MTADQLVTILENHKKWTTDENEGSRADLRWANLQVADLQGADLKMADLRWANLQGSNLQGADLQGADLQGADIDYSCWPLWCGSLSVIVDKRVFAQLAYHLCRVHVDDEECKAAQRALAGIANQFHRVTECGKRTSASISTARMP
jgi:hypothetical protein